MVCMVEWNIAFLVKILGMCWLSRLLRAGSNPYITIIEAYCFFKIGNWTLVL